MTNDTIHALNAMSGEELLWIAAHSNANMKERIERVLDARARFARRERDAKPRLGLHLRMLRSA